MGRGETRGLPLGLTTKAKKCYTKGDNMTTVMDMEFECCGTKYSVPLALGDDQMLLHQPALGDTMIMLLEAQHSAEHPECLK